MGKAKDLAGAPWRAFAQSKTGKVMIVTAGTIVLAAMITLITLLVPAFLLAAAVWVTAWARSWEAATARNWALGLGGTYVAATMIAAWDVTAPVQAYQAGLHLFCNFVPADMASGLIEASPLWVPIGLGIGAWSWTTYRLKMVTGRAAELGWGERHKYRHHHNRMADARRVAESAPVPLTTPDRTAIVIGPAAAYEKGVTRGIAGELRARHPRWVTLPLDALGQHVLVVGDSGSGKTTLMRRLGLGAAEMLWHAHAKGEVDRPLILFLDCKGGPKAPTDAADWISDMIRMGVPASRCATWPFTTRLDIWSMAPTDQQACLQSLVRASHEHFDELRESLLHLVIDAPSGPPKSSLQFLSRIDPDWLKATWAGFPVEMGQVEAVCDGKPEPAYLDARLKYGNLFRHLGTSIDAGYDLNDFDAMYFGIAGTKRPKEAQAQAAAIMQLVTDLLHRSKRQALIVLDEYSAVSGGVGIGLIDAVERWRSLGASVIVGAQSWEGLADNEDDRSRLASTFSGGRLMMRSTNSESLSDLSGTIRTAEASQHIKDHTTGADGSFRIQEVYAVHPQRIREMEPGDIAYAAGGGVTWGRVGLVPELSTPAPVVDTTPMVEPAVSLMELEAGITAGSGGSAGKAQSASSPRVNDEAWNNLLGELGLHGDDDDQGKEAK